MNRQAARGADLERRVTDLDRLVTDLEQLVAGAATLDMNTLAPALLDQVGVVFADMIGVIGAGSRSPQMRALAADPALGLTDDGPSRVLVPGTPRGAAHTAAWLNGTAGTFLELDEGFRPTGHPGIHVIPAALAVAEATHASGARLAHAIVAGYEVAARCFESFRLPLAMHPHGHFGGLGAATAVAILEGEDPVALARIAATQPLLTGWDACYDGATARNSWSGHANRAGVLAGVMHRAGFTGSMASHLSVVAPFALDAGTLGEPVGPETLRIQRNYLKFHSACALTHSSLDAAFEVRRQLTDAEIRDIQRIEVVTVTNNLRIARQAAPNELSTRFSLPYSLAAALITGSSEPAVFEWREDIADLAARVTVEASPAMDAEWPSAAPASVRVFASGRMVDGTVDNPVGYHDRPASREQIVGKFVALGGSATAFERLADLGAIEDCAALPLALDGATRAHVM